MRRLLLKKWPELVAQAYKKAEAAGLPLRIFFRTKHGSGASTIRADAGPELVFVRSWANRLFANTPIHMELFVRRTEPQATIFCPPWMVFA